MGTKKYQNRTSYIRCPKDEEHPFNRVPASLYKLDGYQFAIMGQILSNRDDWNIVQKEIRQRVKFPRKKFDRAWDSLVEMGYIEMKQIQGGWLYKVHEDPSFTSTTAGNCENLTYTTGGHCEDGILTTTNNNYYTVNKTILSRSCHKKEFQELLEIYPREVKRSDGKVYKLHTRLKDSETLYSEYLDSGKMSHEEIKTALKVELHDRFKNGTTQFQKNIYNWISDNTFHEYKDKIVEAIEQLYGCELI